MKILTIGDLHGLDNWKDILFGSTYHFELWKTEYLEGIHEFMKDQYPFNGYDKIVFVGDYPDSYDLSNHQILTNLEDVILFKKAFPDVATLLYGNHCVAYIVADQLCTGHRWEMRPDLYRIFTENANLFQVAFQIDNYLWTHAGVTKAFKEKYVDPMLEEDYRFFEEARERADLAGLLNLMFEGNDKNLYRSSPASGGLSLVPGPLWARPNDIVADPLPGYAQIVGHTRKSKITEYGGNDWKLIVVDVLGHRDVLDHYVLEI